MLEDQGEVQVSSEPPVLNPEPTTPENLDDPSAELQARIAELEQEVAQLKDEKLRALAESQNMIRRFRQDTENQRRFAHEGLVRDLIPVMDNFDRTLAALAKGASAEAVAEGVRAIEKQLRKAVEAHGVKRIHPAGEAFDPERHEAVVTHATDEHPEDTVLDVLEAGYVLHDRVIRPSRVRVSKKT